MRRAFFLLVAGWTGLAQAQTPAALGDDSEAAGEAAGPSEAPGHSPAPSDTATRPEDAEARTRFELGSQLYERGRFEEASAEFRRAYDLSGRASLLYNVYLAERDAGHAALAAEALRRYLDEAEAPENRELLEQRLLALERQAERERQASEHAVANRPAASAPPRPNYTPPLAVMGGGAAVLAAAGALGLANRALYRDLQDRCYAEAVCVPAEADDVDALARRNLTADVLVGVGGAVILGGLVWLLVEAVGRGDDVTAGCGVDGCQLGGRF